MKLKIKKLHSNAIVPQYQTQWASGFDLHALKEVYIPGNSRIKVPTGLAFEVAKGFEMQVRPRSGVSLKTDLTVMFGTVDADYRGEVGIIVHNTGKTHATIGKGDRIAQGVICPVMQVEIEETDGLTDTERGADGFGSSGT